MNFDPDVAAKVNAETDPEPFRQRVWVLADPRAGTAAQAIAVAEALGADFKAIPLDYSWMAALPNQLLGASFRGIAPEVRREIAPPWPHIVIAAGRRAAPVARAIKKRAADENSRPFLVQIMYPGSVGLADFDLVAVPEHDQVAPASNILPIIGAPHRMTPSRLEKARQEWQPRWLDIPAPRVALLVGGATRRRKFTGAMAAALGKETAQLVRQLGGSLMMTTSRRTGNDATLALSKALSAAGVEPQRFHRWGDPGDNPYDGLLACADVIVVTGDSVSMCCEACAAGTPVYIFAPPGFASERHQRLHQELYRLGIAQPLGGEAAAANHPPFNPAADIAREIRRRIGV